MSIFNPFLEQNGPIAEKMSYTSMLAHLMMNRLKSINLLNE